MTREAIEYVEGLDYRTGNAIRINIGDGTIHACEFIEKRTGLPWIGPGLVDLQVNGFAGHDFNTLPLTTDTIFAATQSLWKEGVTSYCPTVITNGDANLEPILRAFATAFRQFPILTQVVAGIHLEGPFISPEDGPRGAHDRTYIKSPDWSLFQHWQDVAEGHIRLLTLSPEWPDAPRFIEKCVAAGVKVAIGHTAANTEQIAEAVLAGASLSTHLGNGAHAVLPRHPNYIWDQLANDDLWAGMIADGFHLPDSVLKVFMRVKREKAMLVSDVVYLGGLEPGEYDTHIGGKVVLSETGRLFLKDQPQLLAGSVQTLRQGIGRLSQKSWYPFSQIWEMGSVRPASYLDLAAGRGLAVGAPADIVLFERAGSTIEIICTIKQGLMLYDQRNRQVGGKIDVRHCDDAVPTKNCAPLGENQPGGSASCRESGETRGRQGEAG